MQCSAVWLGIWLTDLVCRYLPDYSLVARAHGDAVLNGTVIPGEAEILNVV